MRDDITVPTRAQVAAMVAEVEALARAKSAQDIDAAVAIYHPQAVVELAVLGARDEGSARIRAGLELFYTLLPDYGVTLEGYASAPDTLVYRGTIGATVDAAPLGLTGNGHHVTTPVHMRFRFRDGTIAYEGFEPDFAAMCRASGISADRALDALEAVAASRRDADRAQRAS